MVSKKIDPFKDFVNRHLGQGDKWRNVASGYWIMSLEVQCMSETRLKQQTKRAC